MINFHKVLEQKKYRYFKHIFCNNRDTKITCIKINNLKDRYSNIINKLNFNPNYCYLLSRVKGFNTFFMNYSVDIIFLNKNKIIISIYEDIYPNKITPEISDSYYCIVFARGTVQYKKILVGDQITIKNVWTNEENR